MKNRSRGFGLIEIMVALVLGLVVVAGIIQIFISTKTTYQTQNTAGRMQEDARFVLSKLMQEIRMTGMYGCLRFDTLPVTGAIAPPPNLSFPILWDAANSRLTLVTADVGTTGTSPTWTVISDCRTSSQVFLGTRAAALGQIAFPLRQLVYTLSGNQLTVRDGLTGAAQILADNVSAFNVTFGITGSPMSYTNTLTNASSTSVRSVRLTLTLNDPTGQVRAQTYNVVAALRNRF
ncbi:PilW family protein [Pseudomonas sp. LS-2]|jgi:type IV pilus assembly protein PilW|uniref:PilW family protein n=1 Tax=Pseudomonas sp. LS-2 TaxID=2315859 RepID=UPI000E7362CB|nr:prepilin-type N-terminal cleavage/methylation domain-containing protein [Pseudomonas sp. LS-2]RJX75937.1 prepilin-type N-terminal cleavage/methylation domain-containing protein [Pseudomonas sp. LS-2]